MKNRGKVPQKQYDEFLASFLTALPELTPAEMQAWIRLKKTAQRGKLRELFIGDAKPTICPTEWTKFYSDVFGLTVNLADVTLPPETKGFGWSVVIAKELGDKPLNTAMSACRKLFNGKVWQYTNDLDKSVPTNDRDPRIIGSYAIRVRNRVEADRENKDLSANDIKSRQMVTMTLLERVVMELFYFWKTGKHLDIQNVTLCSGSRRSDGLVPDCFMNDDEFELYWCYADSCSGSLRARSEVSV